MPCAIAQARRDWQQSHPTGSNCQTLIAHGLGRELEGQGVACNALWPATMVESFATINFQMGTPSLWRKASILADATLKIVQEGRCSHLLYARSLAHSLTLTRARVSLDPNTFTGYALIDEDYLRARGVSDFTKYRCDPNVEPPRITTLGGSTFERGLVTEVKSAELPVAPKAKL